MAGEIQETSKRRILRIVEKQNQMEDAEMGVTDPLTFGSTRSQPKMVATLGGMPL